METENVKKSDMIHYQKINIFGEEGVGKSSLITMMENYDNDNYVIQNISKRSIQSQDSFIISSSIVEQIKKIKIKINNDRDLYYNIYETNLNRFDSIKMNLDTLLVQTECIIIMFDRGERDTFENNPSLISTIESGIKQKKFRDVPIFLIQNKSDLNDIRNSRPEEDINNEIENLKNQYPNIIYKELCLLKRDEFIFLISDIDSALSNQNNKNNNDVVNLVKLKYPFQEKILKNSYIRTIQILLLGDSNTGKTSFLNSLKEEFKDNVLSTVSIDINEILAEVNNNIVKIQIVDTAGQERFRSLASNYYKSANGFLLFFDVTNKDSFYSLKYWNESINNNNKNYNEVIIIANKIDDNEKRKVSKKEAKEYAEKNNFKYFECSAKNGINVTEIINEIILMAFYNIDNNDDNNNDYKDNDNNIENNNNNNEKSEENTLGNNTQNKNYENKRDQTHKNKNNSHNIQKTKNENYCSC